MTMLKNLLAVVSLWMLVCVTASAGNVTYIYTDPQGTPLAEADASGNVTETFDYKPYGAQALGVAPNGPGYTGHVGDPDIGLVYMQARYYDPAIGRFMSVDQVLVSPGAIFASNSYVYVQANPLGLTDPSGMDPKGGQDMDICNGPVPCDEDTGSSRPNSSRSVTKASVPVGTPNNMSKYFVGASTADKIKAAMAVMDYFKIDYSGVSIAFKDSASFNARMNYSGQLDIAPPLFGNSFGMIGAILYHEVGVHWQMQYMKMSDGLRDGFGGYSQAWYMREVQAYDYEISPANQVRFGLTPQEVGGERAKRAFYYDHLTGPNKDMIKRGVYQPF